MSRTPTPSLPPSGESSAPVSVADESSSKAPPADGKKAETDLPQSYINYLNAFQSAYTDLTQLTITYEDLAYEVEVPEVTQERLPNLARAMLEQVTSLVTSPPTKLFHPLHPCTGLVKPGELTLLLAPPGHGRSTLLKSLSGRLVRDTENIKGTIRWNGLTAEESAVQGQQISKLCAFVEQGDVHFPMLTVRETFKFALDNSNADSSLLGSPEFDAQQAKKVELMLELLGLRECADTVVGDTFLRGVSGGQKKRVTLGEMMIGQARALFLDEISTGLDAAATFDIASALKKWTRQMGGSAMVALLQPAPEVFEMFDKLILLRHGHIVFNGTQKELRDHLAACNIVPNPEVDFADWIVAFLSDPPAVWKRDLLLNGTASAMNSMRKSFREEQAQGHIPTTAAVQPNNEKPYDIMKHHHNHPHHHYPPAEGKEQEDSESKEEAPHEVTFHLGDDLESAVASVESPKAVTETVSIEMANLKSNGAASATASAVASPSASPKTEHRRKQLGKIVTSKNVPLSTAALRKSYLESDLHRSLVSEIRDVNEEFKRQNEIAQQEREKNAVPRSAFTQAQYYQAQSWSLWHHTKTCLYRQFLFMSRSPTFVFPRLFQALFMGLVAGSLFYNMGTTADDYSPRLGIILFSMVFISLINMAEIPLASQFKLVVGKQVDAGFYSPFSYVCSVVIMHLPLAFTEVFIYTTCMYWLCAFNPNANDWWFLVFVFLSVNLYVSVTFRSVAYAMRNADVATNIAGPLTSITLLYGGFLITHGKIPNWLIWLYWLSPYSWGLRSGGLNEFHSGRYPDGVGDQYLEAWQISTDQGYKWGGIGYLVGVFFLFIFINGYLLSSKRYWLTTGTRRSHDESHAARHSLGASASPQSGEVEVRFGAHTSSKMEHAPGAQGDANEVTFTQMDLSFSDLKYDVVVMEQDANGKKHIKTRTLLQGVNGYAKAGEMTALMGSSGAGKTTLMDVLAGRKTAGTITGNILINGHPQVFPDFNRLLGYCEQQDIHVSTTTVREAIEFSAKLRLPNTVSDEARAKFVNQILQDLELSHIEGRIIGDENISGISPGELKRVTIGVELAANPTFLFLDEPTSGLDSRAALIVLRAVRNISRRGRSVVCTIHQPSAELFGMFDRLLLLKSGGKEVYFGPVGEDGVDVASYFLHAAIEDKYYHPSLPENVNVASWMLDVIGAGTSAKGLIAPYDIVYKESQLRVDNLEMVKKLSVPHGDSEPVKFDTVYASSTMQQFQHVLYRLFLIYWRDISYNMAKFRILLFMSFVFGFSYLQIDDSDEAGLNSKIGCLYASVGFVSTMHVSYSMPFVLRMRAVFYRERASNTYAPWVYSTCLGIVEMPYLLVCTFMFVIPMYFMIGFKYTGEAFWHFTLVMMMVATYCSFLGQLFSSLSPNMQVSDIFASMCLDLVHLFGGVLIHKSAMPENWQWFYYINSMPKAIVSIAISQWRCDNTDGTCPTLYSNSEGREITQWDFVKDYMASGEGWEFYYLAWLLLMIIIVRILVHLTIVNISHVRR